jgi:D-lactate dehydrogenase
MKVLFFEIKKCQEPYLSQCLPSCECIFFDFPLTASTIPQEHLDAEIISVFICSNIDTKVLDTFPNLKLIVTRSTGYDHIDIKEAQKRNITICNAPLYASISVAEHTFALMLAFARNLIDSARQIKKQDCFSCEGLNAFELNGKTVGIIGYGNIGKKVARIARGFNMKLLIHDDYAEEKTKEFVDLATLLKNADFITLHVPLTKHTYHLINDANIKMIKPGAYLINTSRGSIIETESLVKALSEGILAGAGLDVLEHKPHNEDRLKLDRLNEWLMNQPNVIITPHCAFASKESIKRLLKSTIDCIKAWLAGKPICCINK